MISLESKDILHQKIGELEKVNELRDIFPEIFEDGKLNIERLKNLLFDIKDEKSEHYSFNWSGKQDCYKIIKQKSNLTLKVDDDKNILDGNNIFIEGDNLEVLKLLQTSYHKKIKMIYIDPPYNKDKDFVYSDTWGDTITNYLIQTDQLRDEGYTSTKTNSTGRRHTNWLNMIYPRLWLSRNLLKDDGVIFVSIDDDEVHNLRKVMDEIYGEENFVALLPTIMNLKGNNDEYGFAGTHEYTIVYAKNKETLQLNEFNINEDEIEDWNEDEYGFYKQGANLKATGTNAPREKRPNLYFPIFLDEKDNLYITDNDLSPENYEGDIITLYPITNGQEMSWRWSKNKFLAEKHNIIISRNGTIGIYKKQRPSLGDMPSKKPKTLFYKPEYSSGNGTSQIKELFNERLFSNPKPLKLIRDFIELGLNKNDIILDFFAGSGTTAHAVMELNQEDGGDRKYILVQLPEATEQNSEAYKAGYKKISDITKERIKRVIEKLDYKDGFKSYRLDSSNFQVFKELKKRPNDSFEDIVKMLKMSVFNRNILTQSAKDIDIVYEVGLKNGFSLSAKSETIKGEKYSFIKLYEGDREFYFCFADKVGVDIAECIPSGAKLICFDKALSDDTKLNLKDKINLETL